ncbi:MAG: NAD(+) diphosphatase [Paracoccaceae bacterium]
MSLLDTVTFARPGPRLDRAAHRRPEAAALLAAPRARAVVLSEGKVAVALDGEKRLARRPLAALAARETVFLGIEDGAALAAADLGPLDEASRARLLGEDVKLIDLRSIAPDLAAREAEIAATARAMLSWHARHGFCAVCGAPSASEDGGWRRRCTACAAPHFPRVDPVVIMLVLREDHVLIGRQPQWPQGLNSLLAGYVEPGETPADAVRREVMEEAGVPVGRVRPLAAQPWPFPSTLMMGYVAEGLDWPITIDPAELESAEWVARADMAEALAGRHPRLGAPRVDAIARVLVAAWLAGEIEGA